MGRLQKSEREALCRWVRENVPLATPALELEIRSFEQQIRRSLPLDFRFYLSSLNGMMDDHGDEEVLSFWSLLRIERSTAAPGSGLELLIPFADFLIESHYYFLVIDPSGNDKGIVAGILPDLSKVASNFSEFLDRYLENRNQIIMF